MEGAEVLEASNLDEAMELLGEHADVDLLLLDLNMPGMNGQAGIKRVAESYPQLPLVVLSANDTKEIVQAVIAAGASGFIPKSSSAVVMQSAIRLVLSGGIYLPPQLLMAKANDESGNVGRNVGVKLSDRQWDVLRHLAVGKSNKEICRELELSEGTIKVHIAAIFRNLNVSNRTEAVALMPRVLISLEHRQ